MPDQQDTPSPAAGGGESSEITEAMKAPRRDAPPKVYIKVDMEGVSGVVSPEQLAPGSEEYEYSRGMLMQDLKAVLEGVFAGGCSEAVIYDAHGHGRNVDLQALDGRAMVISGRPRVSDGFFCGLRDGFSALFLVGYHARAGASGALLPHTYGDDIAAVRLNSTELGEVGMEAALAGEFGVPLTFVSGDSATVREARELLGDDLEGVEVKKAVSATSGLCLPAARTAEMLREGARRALRKAARMPPVAFQSPAVLEVEFKTPESVERLEQTQGIERDGERTIRTSGPTVLAAYRQFSQARGRNGHARAAQPSSKPSSTAQ